MMESQTDTVHMGLMLSPTCYWWLGGPGSIGVDFVWSVVYKEGVSILLW